MALLVVAVFPDLLLAAPQSFEFMHVVRLGSVDGPDALAGEPRELVRDSGGRYYMTEWRGGERVLVFSPAGRFDSELGRAGDGPGEFRNATGLAVDAGDSLWVVDRAARRTSVFTPAGIYARSFRTPGAWTIEIMPNGAKVFGGAFVLAGLTVRRVAVLAPMGTELRTIGPPTEVLPGVPSSGVRLASRRRGGVWRSDPRAYRVSAWTLAGGCALWTSPPPPLPRGRHQRPRGFFPTALPS